MSGGHEGGRDKLGARSLDTGDLIVVLLAGTLADLRDKLTEDGFEPAAEMVADLVEAADDYLAELRHAGPAHGELRLEG
jgi:hypothetical protein